MTPKLTDRAALLRNRRRARIAGPAGFLHDHARAEIAERLSEVNRTFTQPALVTSFPEIWSELLPDARVVSDEETLRLEPGAHDLVVHAMALHWADDPVGQFVQCRRALRPDGLFICVTPGGRTLSELRIVLAETESRLSAGLSPRVAPMGDIRDLGALLQRGGFTLPVADAASFTVTYRCARDLMCDLRAMGEANALLARDKRPLGRAFFDAVDAAYADQFPAESGRIRATAELIFLTGWAPSETQQRPLRPGSASHRLAEALGTSERSAGETAPNSGN